MPWRAKQTHALIPLSFIKYCKCSQEIHFAELAEVLQDSQLAAARLGELWVTGVGLCSGSSGAAMLVAEDVRLPGQRPAGPRAPPRSVFAMLVRQLGWMWLVYHEHTAAAWFEHAGDVRFDEKLSRIRRALCGATTPASTHMDYCGEGCRLADWRAGWATVPFPSP